jgi:hypothetical protein
LGGVHVTVWVDTTAVAKPPRERWNGGLHLSPVRRGAYLHYKESVVPDPQCDQHFINHGLFAAPDGKEPPFAEFDIAFLFCLHQDDRLRRDINCNGDLRFNTKFAGRRTRTW